MHRRRRVEPEVGDLAHLDLVDAGHQRGRTIEREQVAGEPGVDAGAVERATRPRRTPAGARRPSAPMRGVGYTNPTGVTTFVPDAQDAAHAVDVGVQRRVVHAVGAQGEDLVDVVGREHARSGAMPASSPASLPAFSGLVT